MYDFKTFNGVREFVFRKLPNYVNSTTKNIIANAFWVRLQKTRLTGVVTSPPLYYETWIKAYKEKTKHTLQWSEPASKRPYTREGENWDRYK